MNYRLILLAILSIVLSFQPLSAKKKVKEVKIEGVKGMAIGSTTESMEDVTARAINEAKTEALKRAGVAENIASYSDYFKSEEAGNYEELFTSDILSDIQGSVKDVEVIDVQRGFTQEGNLKIEVTINCTVMKYETEKDIAFDAWIEGFKMFYPTGTPLTFTVKVSKNAWIKMFLISESEAYQLFPNDYESSFVMQANQIYDFPTTHIDYILETDKKSEIHRAIIVLLKEDIPYTQSVEYKEIVDWIFTIPPDMRIIKTFGFSVVDEEKMK